VEIKARKINTAKQSRVGNPGLEGKTVGWREEGEQLLKRPISAEIYNEVEYRDIENS
jgi:hypothetical protein